MKLEIHPDKISIETLSSGVDFLGFVNFFDYRILRTKTKRRMFKKLKKKYEDLQKKADFNRSLQSYLGILRHCRGHKIEGKIRNIHDK